MATPKHSPPQKFQLHHLLLLIGLGLLFSIPIGLMLFNKAKKKTEAARQETPTPLPDSVHAKAASFLLPV